MLLLDEFGKSLEAAARTAADGDLFLLQELAERSLSNGFAVVTLQHMGYGDYASDLSAAQRREWAKVQGRFEEISYVEGPSQTLRLVSAAFEPISDPVLLKATQAWSGVEATSAAEVGLTDLTHEVLAATWPLHPAALLVLPELVQRYGQNERTLFSFLASPGARSVTAWLDENTWDGRQTLPSVRLPQLYDYFVDAATSMSGYSAAATRWLEIDTRIRDARGLDPAQLRVVKAVGLLNLIAAGGELRASRTLLRWALADGQAGTISADDIDLRLGELQELGLLSWRDFSDEYRIWQGSDFDIRAAADRARRQLADVRVEDLLASTVPLAPAVAARHSHMTGTLRHFERRWVGRSYNRESDERSSGDGTVLFSVGVGRFNATGAGVDASERPVVVVSLDDDAALEDAAREVAALAALTDVAPADDWVVLRELAERRAEARAALDLAVDRSLQNLERRKTGFYRLVGHEVQPLEGLRTLSAMLSDVADDAYPAAPNVRNELLNREELSSQAAKARRELLDAVLRHSDKECLCIEGFGPERSMYEAVLRATGIHRCRDGAWGVGEPEDETFLAAWQHILCAFSSAQQARRNVQSIFDSLSQPPFGVRAGLAPVLLTCALMNQADTVALYEHGTFKPGLTGDLLERLVRNPQHFEVKHFAARSGARSDAIVAYARALSPLVAGRTIKPSVVSVVGVLVHAVNTLPDYTKRTSRVSFEAQTVRSALLGATEPDVLLFEELPRVLGYPPVLPADDNGDVPRLNAMVEHVARAVGELLAAYECLLKQVEVTLSEVTGSPPERLQSNLRERVALLKGKVLDPKLRRFVTALGAELDKRGWLEYVGMVVAQTAPATWRDDDVDRVQAGLEDLGGTFRRVEALNVEANALERNAAFEASRITVTTPEGHEEARLVWVEARHRDRLQAVLDDALFAAVGIVGGSAQARDALLALLARRDGTVGTAMHSVTEGIQPMTKRGTSL